MSDAWPGVLTQWRLAARDIGLEPIPEDRLRAHLFGAPPHSGVPSSVSLASFYQSYGGVCSAAVDGTALIYVRIFKSGNEVLCDMLRSVDDRSYPLALRFLADAAPLSNAANADPKNARSCSEVSADRVHSALGALDPPTRRRVVVFTAVREPLEHFTAGFAELNLFKSRKEAGRLRSGERAPPFASSAAQGALRSFQNSTAYAKRFIERVVGGGLDLHRVLNAHVLPQVAFLSRRSGEPGRACCGGQLDVIGSLTELAHMWRALGTRVQPLPPHAEHTHHTGARTAVPQPSSTTQYGRAERSPSGRAERATWPPLGGDGAGSHPVTNASAGYLPRERLGALMRDSPAHANALCRILLPDYVCFSFPLPPECSAIGTAHGVTCALPHLPTRGRV